MKRFLSVLTVLSLLLAFPAYSLAGTEDVVSVPAFLMEDDDAEVPASVFEDGAVPANASELEITAPSAILIEKETGTVIYEKNADERREPASVTKVMTILLIVEAIESGSLTLEDMVTVSADAASLGGSQIYLKEGEEMPVRDMLKSIVVSSANDAAVAMAEKIAGSETVFVAAMNERARQLGMKNTHFTNCTGLLDDSTHLTTARDIAIMSRELIKHGMIKEFTTIWTDTVRNGEFGLSNTNKLVRFYSGATGLKTGFTSRSRYCLSATAERDGVEFIAVILGDATSADRFQSAKNLLNYGFANYTLISAAPDEVLKPVKVELGKKQYLQPVMRGAGQLLVPKRYKPQIIKTLEAAESVKAPVRMGDEIGRLTISNGAEVLGVYAVVAGESVDKLGWGDVFTVFLRMMFTGR